ncbi:MAG: HAMP domain-containing histidine kinase [Chloroflexi bacterium]|nr:HAMP domain-containing histidine kinase [Chloroflexota bacterium]
MTEKTWDQHSTTALALAPMERLARAFAHQMGNEIAYLLGSLELAMKDWPPERMMASLQQGQESLLRVHQTLTQSSLGLAAPRPEEYGWCRLSEVIASGAAKARNDAGLSEASATLVVSSSPPTELSLQGYCCLLERALAALLTNGWEAGAPEVSLEVRPAPPDLTLRVTDGGAGIPEELVDQVADPFWTRKAAPHIGLGLSIALLAAVHHNGSLSVASPGPGRGTTVTLRLRVPLNIS